MRKGFESRDRIAVRAGPGFSTTTRMKFIDIRKVRGGVKDFELIEN